MKTKYVRPDGTPIPEGACVRADNVVDTFKLELRSLNGVSPEQVTKLLQTQFEVCLLMPTERTMVVK